MSTIYLDTSALVRRYDIDEPGSNKVRNLCHHETYRMAQGLVRRYPLRAYDSLHVATALELSKLIGDTMPPITFVTSDHQQAFAADMSGLRIELIA